MIAASTLSLGMLRLRLFCTGAAQRGIRIRVAAAGLDGHVDVLGDARELLRHAVPAREHRVLANFENASHRARILLDVARLYRDGNGDVADVDVAGGHEYQASRRLRRDSTYRVNSGVSVRSTSSAVRSASGSSRRGARAGSGVRCSASRRSPARPCRAAARRAAPCRAARAPPARCCDRGAAAPGR